MSHPTSKDGWQLFVEVTNADAQYEDGRAIFAVGVRATLRARAGNVYLAQTQAGCRQGASAAARSRADPSCVQVHDGDRARSRRMARGRRSRRRRYGAVVTPRRPRPSVTITEERRRPAPRPTANGCCHAQTSSMTGFYRSSAALVALTMGTGCAGALVQPGHRALFFDPDHGGFNTRCSSRGGGTPHGVPLHGSPTTNAHASTTSTSPTRRRKEDVHTLLRPRSSHRAAHRAQVPAHRVGALPPRYRDRPEVFRRGHRPRASKRRDRRRRAHLLSCSPEGERQDRGRNREGASPSPSRKAHRGRERPHRGWVCPEKISEAYQQRIKSRRGGRH